MAQYKTVAGPIGLTVGKKDSAAEAVKKYAEIIDREAVGGWVLDCIHEIPVKQDQGGCLRSEIVTIYYNMLIFRKDD